jgi:hypothetical protein
MADTCRPRLDRQTVLTEEDFDRLCWHDCHIWGMSFRAGEPELNDWTSDFVLDIDFICEWCCTNPNGRFRVSPAFLAFHGVQSPQITINWGESSLAHPLSMEEICREGIAQSSLAPGKTNYLWQIKLNWPEGGMIKFSAFGFTQTLRTEPVLNDEQFLSLKARTTLLAGQSPISNSALPPCC